MKLPVGAKIRIDYKRVFLIGEFCMSGIHCSSKRFYSIKRGIWKLIHARQTEQKHFIENEQLCSKLKNSIFSGGKNRYGRWKRAKTQAITAIEYVAILVYFQKQRVACE